MAVKFEIYREGKRVEHFEAAGAYVVGPESTPMTGEIAWRGGMLQIIRTDTHAAGISLLWDMGEVGSFQLETTRLPHREKPYVLNVELARGRLMKIVQKQEDWNLFDFPKAEQLGEKFKEAQLMLAEALGALDRPGEAAEIGDRCLAMAVDLSEQLAAFHADLLINRRRAASQFVRHIFGCRVDSSVRNPRYRETAAGSLDYACVTMPWRQIQPEEHAFETAAVDEWVDFLNRKRVPIIAGPLIHLEDDQVPDWMFFWENDFNMVRDQAYAHVARMVQRYRKTVAVWNVCAGMNANRLFPMSFEQTIELTRLLVAQVKSHLPGARTLITLTHPFGEYHARGGQTVPPMLFAEMIAQSGINFDGFGLELEMGVPKPGCFVRDLFQISSMLDHFSTLNKPVFLTAVGAPGRASADSEDVSEGRMNPADAGRWRRAWDPQLQADWMEAVYRMALSKPYVESIAWSNLADIAHTLPGGGLLDDIFQPKPAFTRLQEMREKYHQWTKQRPPTAAAAGQGAAVAPTPSDT